MSKPKVKVVLVGVVDVAKSKIVEGYQSHPAHTEYAIEIDPLPLQFESRSQANAVAKAIRQALSAITAGVCLSSNIKAREV